MFKALELLLRYSVYLLCLFFFDNVIFAQTCQGSLISSSTLPQLFPFCPPPSTFNYKDDKTLEISHDPDVFHGLRKKKSEVPIVQKLKSQQYQMMIMIIFFQNKPIFQHVAHELCKDAKVKNKNIT